MADRPSDKPVFHQNRYAEELDRFVTDGIAWLDIGAGHKMHDGWLGASSEVLAARPNYFAGCDLGEDVLENPYLHDARVADAAALPWEAETFDLVSANMVAEHLEEPERVLREIHRVLRPGGCCLFVTPNLKHPVVRASTFVPKGPRRLFRVMVDGAPDEDVFPTHYRLNTSSAVRTLAQRTGLVVEQLDVFMSEPPILPSWFGRLETGLVGLGHRLGAREIASNLMVRLRKP